MKKSVILLIILFVISMLTSNIVKAEDTLDYQNKPIPQMLRGHMPLSTPVNISPYKDTNEKLYAVVGKTQLIKFDEPVKRISITDPSCADLILLSPKELLLNGKKAGRTSLLFWGNSDKPVFFNLVVQQDTDAVIQAVEQIAPNENINYNFTDDGLILSGKVSSTSIKNNIENVIKAYNVKLVDLVESPTKQVLLEVKIAEASRNFTKTLASQFTAGETGNAYSSLHNFSFGSEGKMVFASPSNDVSWMVTAGETKGLIKILAEPKLLAVDGKPGSFNVGQEVPYPSGVAMSGTTSYAFKNTGIILNFTPTILEKSNRVILKLSPEVSEIDESLGTKYGTVGFKTRKVDTTVELADGETLVIAGLLSHTTATDDTIVPGIGEIPGIGLLFSSIKRTKRNTELVIFITPKIVETEQTKTGLEL